MAKGLSAAKAKKILEDGTVRGKALTEKQKKFFGAVAGGATPLKKLNGGWLEKFDNGGVQPNYNDSNVSLPPGFKGYGYDKGGRAYNGAWNGPVAQEGIELNTKYIDSTFNANMDKRWVQRLYEKNPEFYLEGQTNPSTHFMESGDGYVYPRVMEGADGQLKEVSREEGRSQGIKFPNDEIAQWFAKNYKKGTNVLKEYQMGGSLSGATGMMYARTSGTSPEEPKKAQNGEVMYGTPEYEAAYREGRFADVPNPIDEVVITSGVDYEKYPLYDKLSVQQKEYFNDPGPIGRGVRRAAQTDRGLAEDTYDVVNPIMYGALGVAGGMMAGPSVVTLGRAAAPYASRYLLNPIQRALNYKPLGGPVSVGNVLDVGSAAYAGYATPEAYDRFKENPSFDTGTDLALTAMDLVPFGEIFTGFKGTRNLYNKGKNLLTNDLKPNPDMYYRGIGQAGLDDALQSGLLRAKPADQIAPAMVGPFDIAKRFNNLYVTPRLGVAQSYGKGVVAEVPTDVANFSKRYKGSDWSMMTNNQIPIEQVNFYKKNFFGNYKPIDIPSSSLSDMPWIQPNIYPTSSPLPKNMEPYLSRKVYPFTKEQEIFESFLPIEARLKNIDLKSIRYDADGNIIPNMEYGGDIDEAQWGKILKGAKNLYKRYKNSNIDNFEFKSLPTIEKQQFIKVVDGDFESLEYDHLIPTTQEITDLATKTRSRLMSDKFIKNNMEATGRSKDEVVGYIDDYIKEFENSTLAFDKTPDGTAGLYSRGKITIDPRNPHLTKENVLGTLEHEIEHMFSNVAQQGSDLYRHPKFKLVDRTGMPDENHVQNMRQAFEQQVRFRKALGWLEKNAGLKVGDNVTDEQVEALTDAIANWSKEQGKDFRGTGSNFDIQHLFSSLDAEQFLKPGQYLMPNAPRTANLKNSNVRKAIKDILNKTYSAAAVGGLGAASQIGPVQEDNQFKDGGWLDKFQEGGEIDKAQWGKLLKLAKKYGNKIFNFSKPAAKVDNTSALKYTDDLSYEELKDIRELNYKVQSKTDKQTRKLGKPHEAQEEYGEGWKYSDEVDFNNPEEVAAHRKRWIDSQKKGNFLYQNRSFPLFDETSDVYTDLTKYDLSSFVGNSIDRPFVRDMYEPKTSKIDFGDLLKNKNRDGGVIEDDRGQWAHPGKVTKINNEGC